MDLGVDGRCDSGVVLLRAKEVLDDVKGLLIDVQVFVRLQELNLVQSVALLDHDGIRIGASLFGLVLAEPQNIFEARQRDLDDLGIHDGQEVTQGRDTTLAHQVLDLVGSTYKYQSLVKPFETVSYSFTS